MKKYRKGVFIVIYKKENKDIKYLILKRKLHWRGYEFPKGGKENNENSEEIIKREIKEETGQEARKIQEYSIEGMWDYKKKLKDRKGIEKQVWKLFSCQIKNSEISIDEKEHEDYFWKEYEEARKILTYKNQKKCLEIIDKKLKKEKMKYESYRKFILESGKIIFSGKDRKENEKLVSEFIGKENLIMHTKLPGSPFSVSLKELTKDEQEKMALFTAKYSQDWKKNRNNVLVDIFSGKDVYKNKKMKTGTFGVKKKKTIKVKKQEIKEII